METFLQFLTRRSGFGKTPWVQFALIALSVLCLLVVGIATWDEGGWVSVVFAVAIVAVMVYGTWRNFKGKQA